MRILVVEDEKKLAGFIKRALKEDGHAVDLCHDGDEAAAIMLRQEYDSIVLDLQLPGRDGLSILEDLRERSVHTPVLVLTARDTVRDRVRGLDTGADDYMTKPFSLDELRARVRVMLRRREEASSPLVLQFADVTLHLLERTVRRAAREIVLTPKEFAVLEYLMRNPGHVLRRTSIAEHVWDYNFDRQSNVVEVFVTSVRRKLEDAGEPRLIHTVRSVGYILKQADDALG